MNKLLLKTSENSLHYFDFKKVKNSDIIKYEKEYNNYTMFDFLTLQILKNDEIIIKGLKKSTIDVINFFYKNKNSKLNNIDFTFFEKSKKIISGIYLNVNNYFKSDKELIFLSKNKLIFDILKLDRDLLKQNAPNLTKEDLSNNRSYSLNKEMVINLLHDLEKISNISCLKLTI